MFKISVTHPQLVHLTFHGGLASYSMAFHADGSTRKTDHNLSVDVIGNSDYNALEQCFFAIKGQAKLTPKSTERMAPSTSSSTPLE
ncbi:uncharacterized protein FTJAE_6000 [Fusarium tjaetaba]|uniref:Uncharacterized protein n=1 Tax=Fusarium tjaetaba TaxID=1567544 RepID=A0A8H5RNG2_9HYPO|nr:uncharacterized protein FTJAE_6000 [Fusarium tjaetaba]KAF5636582.1 hypothetical protein FTJAE_6000 [Fusarium tjaetaba]